MLGRVATEVQLSSQRISNHICAMPVKPVNSLLQKKHNCAEYAMSYSLCCVVNVKHEMTSVLITIIHIFVGLRVGM